MRRRCSHAARPPAPSTRSSPWNPAACSRMPGPATASAAPARSRALCSACPSRSRTASIPATTRRPAARRRCAISGRRRMRRWSPPAAAGAIVLGKTNLHELSYRLDQQQSGVRRGAQSLRPHAHSRRQQRRHGGGDRRAPGAARSRRRHGRVHSRACGILRHRRLPTDHRALLDPRLRADFPAVRSGRDRMHAAWRISRCSIRWWPRTAQSLEPVTAARRAPRRRARLLVHRSRSGGRAHLTRFALTRLKDAGVRDRRDRVAGLARLIDLTTDPVQNHDVRFALARYLKEYGAGRLR